MTKKDCIWLAAHLKVARNRVMCRTSVVSRGNGLILLNNLSSDMADDLGRQNPGFDRAKFMAACGRVPT